MGNLKSKINAPDMNIKQIAMKYRQMPSRIAQQQKSPTDNFLVEKRFLIKKTLLI